MTVFNETFDSVTIIEELLTTMAPIAKKSGNLIVLEKSNDIPKLYNDAVKFRQLLLNLLSNACKFTQNGKITILAKKKKKNNHAVFHVSDTGIGMTASQIDRVFKAFVQADSSTSKKYGGTGLGLAICKQFVELMQGSMDVTSAEGKGTTFTVLLPAKAVIQAPKDAIPSENQQELSLDIIDQTSDQSSQEDAGDSLERILVIDDDPAARASLFRQLKKEGYQALEANNAKDGIKIANEQQPDLILLDLMMPTIDSWTTLSALKESEQTRHIPVILQSTPKEKTSELDLDATELLPKPVDRQRMTTALRHLNPQDRRSVALRIAPESEARDSLLEELADEAWQCISASSDGQSYEYLQEKSIDIVFIGLDIARAAVADILAMLSEHQKNSAQAIPIYIVSGVPLSEDHSRRLDLPADQIIF